MNFNLKQNEMSEGKRTGKKRRKNVRRQQSHQTNGSYINLKRSTVFNGSRRLSTPRHTEWARSHDIARLHPVAGVLFGNRVGRQMCMRTQRFACRRPPAAPKSWTIDTKRNRPHTHSHSQAHLSRRMGPGLETWMSSRSIIGRWCAYLSIGECVCVCVCGAVWKLRARPTGNKRLLIQIRYI